VRLVLWDLDGTLVHAGPASREAVEAAFAAAVGRPLARPGAVSFSGRTDPWIARELCRVEGVDPASVDAVAADLLARLPHELAHRRGRLAREGVVLPHAQTTLAALAGRGVRSGVVTGNLRATARLKLEQLGLAGALDLDAAAYGDDGPTRDALVPVALARAGASSEDAWVVGDTPHDLACARAAGVRCLLVATGSYGLDALAALGPEAVLPDLEDAAELLAS
jgi:phosphoglycolate phosphatase-like HAD superfamily hydrolase